ncbi:MAG: RlmE family RNA methyltransferase [Alphaproteobacteria bacterium]|nr:RlmE family RNA methyltransferase [Alphaproteobacteria bacterium]
MTKTINTSIKGRSLFVKVKTAKRRKKSSSFWLQRHFNDPYVVQSKKDGYRSRAAYKLLEIDTKFKVFRKNDVVLDLGAAPGSWAQVAQEKGASQVIGIDLLEVEPINNVEFIQEDFTTEEAYEKIKKSLDGKNVNIIISDMAPNMSGHKKVDHLRIIALCEEVFAFAQDHLAEGGSLVMKIFQGGAEGDLLKEIKRHFIKIKHFKPNSSRKASYEIYLIATGFKGKQE